MFYINTKPRLGKLLMSVLPGASKLQFLLGAEVCTGAGGECRDDVGASGFLRWVEGKWRGLPVVGTAT